MKNLYILIACACGCLCSTIPVLGNLVPMSELIAACPEADPTLRQVFELMPKGTRTGRGMDPALRQQQAAERKAQFKPYLACLLKFYRNGIRKGFAVQKEQLRDKMQKIQAQLSSQLNEQISDMRKFSKQEWDFLMQAVDSYFVALNAELDALAEQTQIDVDHPQGRGIYYGMFSKETTKMGNASKITEFVNYLASLKGKGKNDTMITNLRDALTAASPETVVIGSECVGLEFLFGSDYAQLTDDEKKYVDQIGCPASGYFKGA
jgi:hypothetical protein